MGIAPKYRRGLLTPYVLVVVALAIASIAVLASGGPLLPPIALALVTAAFIGEIRPVVIRRDDGDNDTVGTSAPFVVMLVILGAPLVAIVAHAFADLVVSRKSALRVAFNMAQHTVAAFAATAVYASLVDDFSLADQVAVTVDAEHALAAILAALVYFVVNNLLVTTAIYLNTQCTLRELIAENIALHTAVSLALVFLAPFGGLGLSASPIALAFIPLQVFTVYYSGRLISRHHHQAHHDSLTGLPNRELFWKRAELLIAGTPDHHSLAVLMVDLDRFKEVNDSLGHATGDLLLVEVGKRLGATLGENGELFRLGGDEFAVILPETNTDEAVATGNALLAALARPMKLENIELVVQGSVGVALFSEHAKDPRGLLKAADVALYRAKEHRGEVKVFHPDGESAARHRLVLVAELHRAVEEGGLHLAFQPKVDATTLDVTGFEALARWSHPTFGFISPEVFIPIAESTGLIVPLTKWLVRESASAAAEFRRTTGTEISVSLNASNRLVTNLDFSTWVTDALDEFDLPGSALVVEVTEGTLITDPDRALAVLEGLRERGVKVSIDDFGTGYSSLRYLPVLRPDELKIDRGFVLGMSEGSNAAVIRMAVGLGRELGIDVVAEGVETVEDVIALVALGVTSLQGYHFSRPVPRPAAVEFLASYADRAGREELVVDEAVSA